MEDPMSVFDHGEFSEHEDVIYCHDRATGLRAIIAIHDTTLGPALGGLRMWPYASDDEALTDVLRLSRGMTYKAAMAGLNQGGGKAVIIGDPRSDKSPELFQSFGRFVEQLGGRYITAEDVGTSVADLGLVAGVTDHVAGLAALSGDPSPATAWGVYHGIRAAVAHRLQRPTLEGVKVAVQGVGHVGYYLCQYLAEAGAQLTVTDIDAKAMEQMADKWGANTVHPDSIYEAKVDVFAPCAMGAVINDETLPRLQANIVAGSANNQLSQAHHGESLAAQKILYAPDYVINAGGIINISHERPVYDEVKAYAHTAQIHDTLMDLFRKANAAQMAPEKMADKMAEARIFNARQQQNSVAA
jgi:leucine dehydrogenase